MVASRGTYRKLYFEQKDRSRRPPLINYWPFARSTRHEGSGTPEAGFHRDVRAELCGGMSKLGIVTLADISSSCSIVTVPMSTAPAGIVMEQDHERSVVFFEVDCRAERALEKNLKYFSSQSAFRSTPQSTPPVSTVPVPSH